MNRKMERFRQHLVLIVPYGIETYSFLHLFISLSLVLIVPYGIETWLSSRPARSNRCINCTLWN